MKQAQRPETLTTHLPLQVSQCRREGQTQCDTDGITIPAMTIEAVDMVVEGAIAIATRVVGMAVVTEVDTPEARDLPTP